MKTLIIESETHGIHHVLLDDEDYDRVIANRWYILKGSTKGREVFYVTSNIYANGTQKSTQLHRFIMNAPKGKIVDHINGDGRDNRKENLRICTRSENARNQHCTPRGSIPYRGVDYYPRPKRVQHYRMTIKDPKTSQRMTSWHYSAELAALAYDELAKQYHGEFLTLNFPDGPPPDIKQKIIESQKEYEEIVNSRPRAEKQSKQTGVTWNRNNKNWMAVIRLQGKAKYIGSFSTEEEAIKARLAAEAKVKSGKPL